MYLLMLSFFLIYLLVIYFPHLFAYLFIWVFTDLDSCAFIHGLFNEVCNADYIAPSDRMVSE
jgi:hypothetical protein